MTQLDLFPKQPGPRARHTDPLTSQHAAAKAARWWRTQAGRVLRALIVYGPGDAKQIAARIGPDWSNVRVCRRLSDLVKLQYVRRTGQSTADGDQWSATASGLAWWEARSC